MKDLAETPRRATAQQSGFADAGVYDPPGVGGTHVIYVLHDAKNPELYGGLPKDPHIPWTVQLWKKPLKWLGNAAMLGGLLGLAVHYLRFGPKTEEGEETPEDRSKGSTTMRDRSPTPSERTNSALHLSRAPDALGRGHLLRVSASDGPRVLVALAVLACVRVRRREHFPRTASLGRTRLHRRRNLDVRNLGRPNARDRTGQGVVAALCPLHPERGRQGPEDRAVSMRDRNRFSGDFSGAGSHCFFPASSSGFRSTFRGAGDSFATRL